MKSDPEQTAEAYKRLERAVTQNHLKVVKFHKKGLLPVVTSNVMGSLPFGMKRNDVAGISISREGLDLLFETQADKTWLALPILKALLFIDQGSFCMVYFEGKWQVDPRTLDGRLN